MLASSVRFCWLGVECLTSMHNTDVWWLQGLKGFRCHLMHFTYSVLFGVSHFPLSFLHLFLFCSRVLLCLPGWPELPMCSIWDAGIIGMHHNHILALCLLSDAVIARPYITYWCLNSSCVCMRAYAPVCSFLSCVQMWRSEVDFSCHLVIIHLIFICLLVCLFLFLY